MKVSIVLEMEKRQDSEVKWNWIAGSLFRGNVLVDLILMDTTWFNSSLYFVFAFDFDLFTAFPDTNILVFLCLFFNPVQLSRALMWKMIYDIHFVITFSFIFTLFFTLSLYCFGFVQILLFLCKIWLYHKLSTKWFFK